MDVDVENICLLPIILSYASGPINGVLIWVPPFGCIFLTPPFGRHALWLARY